MSVTMRQMLEAGVHFGHQTRRWDPKMREYIFGERNGIYIVDLQKTQAMFGEALRYVHDVAASGGVVLFVVFGVSPPGEWIIQLLRGDVGAAFRRASRGDVAARLGGQDFFVRYHRQRDIVDAMAPAFRLTRRLGIGVFVPPSAAEPWISGHPRIINLLERLDRVASRPLALLGDHVLFQFEGNGPVPA